MGSRSSAGGAQHNPEAANTTGVRWAAQDAPRLSLDCGMGAGPAHTPPAAPGATDTPFIQFVPHPPVSSAVDPRQQLMPPVRPSLDTNSDALLDSPNTPSDGSSAGSGALAVRGGSAAAALALSTGEGPGGPRQLVTRVLRGRASLDAMLMFGALVRAVDEAGLAVGVPGLGPRLERIESGDLPAGEEGHPHHPCHQQAGQGDRDRAGGHGGQGGQGSAPGAEGTAPGESGGVRKGSHEEDASAPKPLWRGRRWSAAASVVPSAPVNVPAPSGAAAARAGDVTSGSGSAPQQSGGGGFTFSAPTVSSNSPHASGENSLPANSDTRLALGRHQQPQQQQPGPPTVQQSVDAQVLEMFVRLLTLTSTTGEAELLSSQLAGIDRSSVGAGSGPAPGSGGGAGGGGTGGAGGGRQGMARSASDRRGRHAQEGRLVGRRGRGRARGSGGNEVAAALAAASMGEGAASTTANSSAVGPGGSAPLLMLPAGAHANRRNSWDVPIAQPGALAAAAAAAAAILRASAGGTSIRSGGGGGGGGGGAAGGATSFNTGDASSSRILPLAPSPLGPGYGGESSGTPGLGGLVLVGALSRQFSRQLSQGVGTSATSLIRLPTGSGSIRDVLSRIQQHNNVETNGHSNSDSWSAHTGLASLFDVHLTAALRRNGAVRTFKRAVCGDPGNVSPRTSASSGLSQGTGSRAPGPDQLRAFVEMQQRRHNAARQAGMEGLVETLGSVGSPPHRAGAEGRQRGQGQGPAEERQGQSRSPPTGLQSGAGGAPQQPQASQGQGQGRSTARACSYCGVAVGPSGECACAARWAGSGQRRSLSLGHGGAWLPGAGQGGAAGGGGCGSGREPSLQMMLPAADEPVWTAASTGAAALATGPAGQQSRPQLLWGKQAGSGGGGGGAGPALAPLPLPAGMMASVPSASLEFSRYSWDTDWGPNLQGGRSGGGPGGGGGVEDDAFTCTNRSSFSQGTMGAMGTQYDLG
ncbi:hypothetical protein GPECTOR_21g671 [Gonium pectorale]|uniref:Uncharacterized protein n=1 Tax=Gonium pectorale TaxID=33097 RepID=A0A150GIE4_GONPE|nr:hypothetical protein GPECTOR_21g671 [Gonium pectorale]|eukprot:KXZ49445.1 hypothetical protein GPECTOR_21g671 [Gonium pectorale]